MKEELENKCKWCDVDTVKSGGLCGVCYRLDRQLRSVEAWNSSATTMPTFLKWFQNNRFDDLPRLRDASIKAVTELIAQRKHLGFSMRNENISGLDLEHLTRNILSRIKGVNKNQIEAEYFHTADFFDRDFSRQQKVDLYRFLRKVLYLIPTPSLTISIIEAYYNP